MKFVRQADMLKFKGGRTEIASEPAPPAMTPQSVYFFHCV